MTKKTAKEPVSMQTEISTKVNGKTMKRTAKGLATMLTEIPIKVNGKTAKGTAKKGPVSM